MELPLKIALLGNTGVGKGTFVEILKQSETYSNLYEIKLATPFYQVQEFIYAVCGVKKDFYVQDGVLLNFLGQHMRFINPDVIKNYFLLQLEAVHQKLDVIVCSDVRPLDISFIKEQGFSLIYISASKEIALKRRQKRGDISLANPQHSTEIGNKSCDYDYTIVNDGTLQEYKNAIFNLMRKIHDTY